METLKVHFVGLGSKLAGGHFGMNSVYLADLKAALGLPLVSHSVLVLGRALGLWKAVEPDISLHWEVVFHVEELCIAADVVCPVLEVDNHSFEEVPAHILSVHNLEQHSGGVVDS